jgi:hypothetical protein
MIHARTKHKHPFAQRISPFLFPRDITQRGLQFRKNITIQPSLPNITDDILRLTMNMHNFLICKMFCSPPTTT